MVGETIQPDLQILYNWETKDAEDEIEIIITVPPTFNTKSLRAELNSDRTAVAITIPDQPPVLMGKLVAQVSLMSQTNDGSHIIFTFTKEEPKAWPFLISDLHPTTEAIDPQSAFIIAGLLLQTNPEENIEKAQFLLFESCNAGFIPALRLAAQMLQSNVQTLPTAIKILEMGVGYRDPVACMQLGLLYLRDKETRRQAERLFLLAAELGLIMGLSYVGQLYSPLTDIEFDEKDAEKAVAIFKQVREVEPEEPIMCHELAMLYYNGVGVEKDEEQAEKLHAMAKKQIKDLPDLKRVEVATKKSGFSGLDAIAIAAVGSVVIGGAFTIYKMWRSKK